MWEKRTCNFGNIKPGSVNKCTFKYKGEKKISSVRAGCSCTATAINGSDVNVEFKAGEIPKNVLLSGKHSADVYRHITVIFADKSEDKLTIIAKIVK